jgi:hypothetical protein
MKQINKFVMIIFFITIITIQAKANKPLQSSKKEQYAAGGIGDFIKTVVNGVLDIGRPVWGSYTVSGQNNSAPIALFKRTSFEKDKAEIIQQIQTTGSDFKKIYSNVYIKATNNYTYTLPASTGGAQIYESRATFAKNAAFVLVLGVDQDGEPLTQYQKDDESPV